MNLKSAPDRPQTQKLSVLLATKDQATTLERCLRGIHEQTFRDYEFLILDDGSTDGTSDILHRWASLDPRIRLFRNPAAQGVIPAYQFLQGRARGEFIWHAASDDFCVDKDFLTTGFRLLSSTPKAAGFFCNTLRIMMPLAKPHGIWGTRGRARYIPPKIFLSQFLSGRIVIPGCATIVRKNDFREMGGFQEEAGPLCDLLINSKLGSSFGMIFTGGISMHASVFSGATNFGSSFDPWHQLKHLAYLEAELRKSILKRNQNCSGKWTDFRYLYLGKFFDIEHRCRQARNCFMACQELTSTASNIIGSYKNRILLYFPGQEPHLNEKGLLRFPFEKRIYRMALKFFDRRRYGFEISL